MTRVLVVDASDRGGIAQYTARLVDGLRSDGVDVHLLAPGSGLPKLAWGDEVARWSAARRRAVAIVTWVRRAAALRAAVDRLAPDVVHLQTAVAGPLEPALLRWCRGRATIVRTIHNAVAHDATRAARRDRALWRRADHLIVHGRDAADAASVAGRPVHVIPADVPDERGPSRTGARVALGVGDEPVAVLLGLLRPYKGVGLLADAWPHVVERVRDARLVVAGSVLEPFADLDRLLTAPNVVAHVRWLADGEVLAWAAAADVCLLPYAHGAHSAVLHRAVAAGTPVLASPALTEETVRLRAGAVVPLDAGAWADAIAGALETPLPAPAPPPPGEQATATGALYASVGSAAPAPLPPRR